MQESDTEIISRAVAGDEGAFEILFNRYQQFAVRVATQFVKSTSDANDITQEAFVRVHKNLPSFRRESRFTTWLYRIVSNLSIDFLRKHRRMRLSDTGEVMEPTTVFEQQFWGVSNQVASPYEALERSRDMVKVNKALSNSAAIHRDVLILRELLGYSYDEIASSLQIQKGTVMSRLFHGRRKLQEFLDTDTAELGRTVIGNAMAVQAVAI